jgi:hypothetical protein
MCEPCSIESHLTLVVVLATQLGAQCCASAYLALWDANRGEFDQARVRAEIAAKLASDEQDDWLLSLVAWAKAWIALGSGAYEDALATLQPFRRVSFDPQQHRMIDIFAHVGPALDCGWDRDSRLSRDACRAPGGLRVPAWQAADIRRRTLAPLFSFWVAHDDEATAWARARLSDDRFDTCYGEGVSARDELVINESRALLSEIAEGHVAIPTASGEGSGERGVRVVAPAQVKSEVL